MTNKHNELLAINVNDHIEKKNGLNYLSWAFAWQEAIKSDEKATFDVKMFGNEPYCKIGNTCMVWVTVTLFGKALTCQLPVMNHMNKAIENPNAFDVNKAIMRCLAKAVALHGVGLYIYTGEDLPDDANTHREQAINREQEANIITLAQEVGADIPKFCQFLRVNHISDLPISQYDRAIKALESKRKAA
jgi:hypothetical protein